MRSSIQWSGVSDAPAERRASVCLAGRDVSQGPDRRPRGEPGDRRGDWRDARRGAPDSWRGRRRVGGSRLLDGVFAQSRQARPRRGAAGHLDAHEGLKQAICTVLSGAAWQRCRVHFMRFWRPSLTPCGSRSRRSCERSSRSPTTPRRRRSCTKSPMACVAVAPGRGAARGRGRRHPGAQALSRGASAAAAQHQSARTAQQRRSSADRT